MDSAKNFTIQMRWTHFFEYYSLLNQTKDEIEFCIAQYHFKFEVVVKNIPTGKKKKLHGQIVLLGNSIEHLRGGGTTVLHKNLSENRGMNHFPTFYENRKTLIQKSVKGIKKQQQLPGHYSSCLNYQQTEIIKI